MKVLAVLLIAAEALVAAQRTCPRTITQTATSTTTTTSVQLSTTTRTTVSVRTRTRRVLTTVTDTETAPASTVTESSISTTTETLSVVTVTQTAPASTITETSTITVTTDVTSASSSQPPSSTDGEISSSTTSESSTADTSSTTSSVPTAAPTGFIGRGNIFVYPSTTTTRRGYLITAGVWYNAGGTPATITGTVVDAATGSFTFSTSRGPCAIGGANLTLTCASGNTATVFGQTTNGNLSLATYANSAVFYAAATPSGTTQQPISALSNNVAINFGWSPFA